MKELPKEIEVHAPVTSRPGKRAFQVEPLEETKT